MEGANGHGCAGIPGKILSKNGGGTHFAPKPPKTVLAVSRACFGVILTIILEEIPAKKLIFGPHARVLGSKRGKRIPDKNLILYQLV